MTYPLEIKQKAIDYFERCKDITKVIEAYGISRDTIYRWLRLKKQTGKLNNQTKGRQPRKIDREKLRVYVEQHPDAYLSEIAEQFNCTTPAVFYALKSIGIPHKKSVPFTKSKAR